MNQSMQGIVFSFCLLFISSLACSQQTITLAECESLFQKNNLLLLATHYDIDKAKAEHIQAKIWELPELSLEFNAINPEQIRFFDIGNRGQKAAQIQQLIYLAGKKKYEVAWNANLIEQAELKYENLIRQLLFELRTAYYDIYFSENKSKRINDELKHIDTLLNAYRIQVQKGNISLKEMVRLESLSLSLRNQLLEINNNYFSQMAKVQLICGINTTISTQVDEDKISKELLRYQNLNTDEIFSIIQQSNPEYLLQLKEIENKYRMLQWQKSLNVPNMYLGSSYDQRGGAFGNQINLTMSISLPFWQKNKGNVLASKADLNKSEILKSYLERDLQLQVQTLLYQLHQQQNLYKSWVEGLNDVQRVYDGIIENFQKRNITLLEFTDFIESYNSRLLSLHELKKQIVQQQQWLNYLANKNLF